MLSPFKIAQFLETKIIETMSGQIMN